MPLVPNAAVDAAEQKYRTLVGQFGPPCTEREKQLLGLIDQVFAFALAVHQKYQEPRAMTSPVEGVPMITCPCGNTVMVAAFETNVEAPLLVDKMLWCPACQRLHQRDINTAQWGVYAWVDALGTGAWVFQSGTRPSGLPEQR